MLPHDEKLGDRMIERQVGVTVIVDQRKTRQMAVRVGVDTSTPWVFSFQPLW